MSTNKEIYRRLFVIVSELQTLLKELEKESSEDLESYKESIEEITQEFNKVKSERDAYKLVVEDAINAK